MVASAMEQANGLDAMDGDNGDVMMD